MSRKGGAGGSGGSGGDGLGGGAFIGPADVLALTACTITDDDADGGSGDGGGDSNGQGVGGGIYDLDPGGVTYNMTIVIGGNFASTGSNNIFST